MFYTLKKMPAFMLLSIGLSVGMPSIAEEKKSETVEAIQKDIKASMETLKELTADRKERAADQVELALEKLDARIDDLEDAFDEKFEEMDEAARKEARNSLQKLRKNRAKMSEWLGAMKHSTASAWDKMKSKVSKSFDALSESWNEAETEIQAETKSKSI